MWAETTRVLNQFLMSFIPCKTSRTKSFLLQDMLFCDVTYFLLNLLILITQLKKYGMPNMYKTQYWALLQL